MGIEQLTKEELIKLYEDKSETLELLSEKKLAPKADYISAEFVHGLEVGRCRVCVGRSYEVPDPTSPTGKKVVAEGQPYVISSWFDAEGNPHSYGDELACRTCQHVRRFLAQHSSNVRVFI
jgi:hypothetical protein